MMDDENGVAGFYVDIPALLAIIVGISIFTFTIYSAHVSYEGRMDEAEMYDELGSFMEQFRRDDYLCSDTGEFEAGKINLLNISLLEDLYSPDELGFHYRITFEDNSAYDNDYSKTYQTSSIPTDKSVYTKRSSVVIVEDNNVKHLSELRISIWSV
ncbi:MAG: hypothetical protein R6U61_00565 [Thermoplasmata archaeon]